MTDPYPQQPYGPYGMPGPYGAQPPGPPPDTNLVWGILTTVMCCLPLGIVSIIKANEVNKLWYQGQYEAARKASSQAGKWALWSALSSVLIIVGVMVIAAIGAAMGEFAY